MVFVFSTKGVSLNNPYILAVCFCMCESVCVCVFLHISMYACGCGGFSVKLKTKSRILIIRDIKLHILHSRALFLSFTHGSFVVIVLTYKSMNYISFEKTRTKALLSFFCFIQISSSFRFVSSILVEKYLLIVNISRLPWHQVNTKKS